MLREGFSDEQIVHVNHNEPQALAYAKWYAVEHGIPRSRIRYLGSEDIPVPGAVVFGRFEPCAFVCNKLVELDEFWLGRSGGAIGGDVDLRSSPPTFIVNTARGSGLKVSFLAQGHVVHGGSAWGYLLRIRQNGKPWRGAILIQVLDGAGNVVDGVGEYAFRGSWLAGYYWPPEDEGKLLHFRITLQGNDKTLGTIDYSVAVRHKYVQ
jgi:hypothetical protein